jgi:hypothetical protein
MYKQLESIHDRTTIQADAYTQYMLKRAVKN